MIFRAIELSRFRKFRDSVTVQGLGHGLNVIAGDNEDGKSTLLTAIRAGLFERFRSSVGESYRPYGQQVDPRVRLEFEYDGKTWTLEKVFSRRKEGGCRLESSEGGRWEGEAAEDFLKQLLDFEYGRGGTKKALQGLPGLLWVEQGHAYQSVEIADGPRDTLHSVFDSEMTEMLGGEGGEALYDRVCQMRSEYFDKRNNPRGDYKKLITKVEQEAGRVPELERQLGEYDDKVARLEELRRRLRQSEGDEQISAARIQLSEANEKLERINDLKSALDHAEIVLRKAGGELELANVQWHARQKLLKDAEASRSQLAELEQQLQKLKAETEPLRAAVEKAREELARDRAELEQLTALRETLREVARRHAAKQELKQLTDRLARAQQSAETKRALQAQIDAATISPEIVQELRTLRHALSVKTETLRQASTRLEYDLQPGTTVTRSGNRLSGRGHLDLTETTELAIQDVGKLVIQPGGSELVELANDIDQATELYQRRLKAAEVQSLTRAEEALAELDQMRQQHGLHASELKAQAPEGIAVLEGRVQEMRSEMACWDESREPSPDCELNENEITIKIKNLNANIQAKHDAFQAEKSRLERLTERLIECRTNRDSVSQHHSSLAAELASKRAENPDDGLAQEVARASQAESQAQGVLQGSRSRLEAADPDQAQALFESACRAVEKAEARHSQLQREIRDLEVELNTLGHRGLGEELDQARIETDDLQRELQYNATQAEALDLLYQTMTEALQNAKRAVARPVIHRMRPYLQQLLPDAEPSIDQDLKLTGLSRGDTEEAFEKLSIGTREQLAILVRLAYADLLAENDIPVTVILDDALVNSDDERRERMKAILSRAARHYQIIVLTCHEREYRDCDGQFFRL